MPRQANGHRHGDGPTALRHGHLHGLHGLAQALHQGHGVCGGVSHSSSCKLFATPAGQHIGVAHIAAHGVGKALQHQVASGVPVGVVDGLEVVNVQLGNQQWRAAAQAAALLELHAIEHGAAVEQAGQVIVRGQLADLLQRLRQFGLWRRRCSRVDCTRVVRKVLLSSTTTTMPT